MFENIKYDIKDFVNVEENKKILDLKRPFPKNTINSLRENLILNWTYNSNSIEGNTLTLSETKVVLEGITIGGKTMVEHLEAINHKEAIIYVEELVKNKQELSEMDIRNIHKIVLSQIDNENAGRYRTENVIISGAKHIPPEHFEVKMQMEELIKVYNTKWIKLHPIARASLLHGEFVKIHPFVDRKW